VQHGFPNINAQNGFSEKIDVGNWFVPSSDKDVFYFHGKFGAKTVLNFAFDFFL
jgi:hypothetical protein